MRINVNTFSSQSGNLFTEIGSPVLRVCQYPSRDETVCVQNVITALRREVVLAKLKNEPKFIAEGENNKQQIIKEHYSRIQF